MGQGISVLSSELADRLSESQLEQFYQYETQCEEKGMSPVDMYLFLTLKYEELLREKSLEEKDLTARVAHKHIEGDTYHQQSNSSVRSTENSGHYQTCHSHLGNDCDADDLKKIAVSSRTERSVTNHILKNKAQIELYEKKGKKAVEDKELVTKNGSYSPLARVSTAHQESFSMKEKIEQSDNINDSLSREEGNHAVHVSHTKRLSNTNHHVHLHSMKQHHMENTRHTKNETRFECKLCRKDFSTQQNLLAHINHSGLHKKALQMRNTKFAEVYEHTETLVKLIKQFVCFVKDKMMDRLVIRCNKVEKVAILRWKWSIKFVIDRYVRLPSVREEFEGVKQGKNCDYQTNGVVDLLRGQWNNSNLNPNITMYHSLYERHRITLMIHKDTQTGSKTLYHAKLLYYGTKFFWRIKTTFNIHILLHIEYRCIEIIGQQLYKRHIDNSNNKDDNCVIKLLESDRIYINYEQLIETVLGLHSKQVIACLLTEDYYKQTDLDNCVEKNGEFMRMESKIVAYLLSHLKIDYVKCRNDKETYKSLYFDCPKRQQTTLSGEIDNAFQKSEKLSNSPGGQLLYSKCPEYVTPFVLPTEQISDSNHTDNIKIHLEPTYKSEKQTINNKNDNSKKVLKNSGRRMSLPPEIMEEKFPRMDRICPQLFHQPDINYMNKNSNFQSSLINNNTLTNNKLDHTITTIMKKLETKELHLSSNIEFNSNSITEDEQDEDDNNNNNVVLPTIICSSLSQSTDSYDSSPIIISHQNKLNLPIHTIGNMKTNMMKNDNNMNKIDASIVLQTKSLDTYDYHNVITTNSTSVLVDDCHHKYPTKKNDCNARMLQYRQIQWQRDEINTLVTPISTMGIGYDSPSGYQDILPPVGRSEESTGTDQISARSSNNGSSKCIASVQSIHAIHRSPSPHTNPSNRMMTYSTTTHMAHHGGGGMLPSIASHLYTTTSEDNSSLSIATGNDSSVGMMRNSNHVNDKNHSHLPLVHRNYHNNITNMPTISVHAHKPRVVGHTTLLKEMLVLSPGKSGRRWTFDI